MPGGDIHLLSEQCSQSKRVNTWQSRGEAILMPDNISGMNVLAVYAWKGCTQQ